jgi:hypothetical protein
LKVFRFRSVDLWRTLWQIATGDYFLAAVLLALALGLLLAAWLPQTPANEAVLDVDWQASVQRNFGDAAWFDLIRPVLAAMGAFHVSSAPWFRLLLALLTLCLLVRLVDSAEEFWREGDSGASHEEAEGLRVRMRAERWSWGALGRTLVYFSGLLVLLGVAVNEIWGWQEDLVGVTAGEFVPLGHNNDLSLRLDELDGEERRGVGEIWRGADSLLTADRLAVGQPLVGEGVGVYLVGSGPALKAQAILSDTQPLGLATGPAQEPQEELTLTFTEDEPRHSIGVPEADLILLLSIPEQNQDSTMFPVLHAQVFEFGSGQPVLEKQELADTNLQVDSVTFILTPVPYAELWAAYDPGAFWSQLGVVGLVLGITVWGMSPLFVSLRRWMADRRAAGGAEAVSPTAADSSAAAPGDAGAQDRSG